MPRSAMLVMLSVGLVVGCSSSDSATTADPATTAGESLDAVQIANDESAALELTNEGSENAGASNLITTVGWSIGADAGAGAVDDRWASPTAAAVAAYMAAHSGAALQPPACHSSTVNGDVVVYTYNDCTGPRGLVRMTGAMTVTYIVDAQGVHTQTAATGFALNQSTLDIDATTTYTTAGGTRTVAVSTQSSGTGPLGHHITRQGDYTTTWTASCHTLNGTWTTTSSNLSGSTTVNQVTRCDGGCPASGGSVIQANRDGVTVTIAYDGSAIAHWSTATGSGTITLTCIPGGSVRAVSSVRGAAGRVPAYHSE
jgi:hypothetical protein